MMSWRNPEPGTPSGASTPTGRPSSTPWTPCMRITASEQVALIEDLLRRHHRRDGRRAPGATGKRTRSPRSASWSPCWIRPRRAWAPPSSTGGTRGWPPPHPRGPGYLDGRHWPRCSPGCGRTTWSGLLGQQLPARTGAAAVRHPVWNADTTRMTAACTGLPPDGCHERLDAARRADNARLTGGPVPGRPRHLPGRRGRRPYLPLAELLPVHPAARRQQAVRAVHRGHIAAIVNPPGNEKARYQVTRSARKPAGMAPARGQLPWVLVGTTWRGSPNAAARGRPRQTSCGGGGLARMGRARNLCP